jgi:hypothetical protein
MEDVYDILKFLLPAFLVGGISVYLVRRFLVNEESRRKEERGLANSKIITPIRLQAYERLTLFLERISPESLIIRERRDGMTNRQLQARLLQAIREEFEHNLSQQVYVSPKCWETVLFAKENMVKLINVKSLKINPQNNFMELSQEILEEVAAMDVHPVKPAILFLKSEVATIF